MKTFKTIALIAALSIPTVTVTGIMDYYTPTISSTLTIASALSVTYSLYLIAKKYGFDHVVGIHQHQRKGDSKDCAACMNYQIQYKNNLPFSNPVYFAIPGLIGLMARVYLYPIQ